MPRERRYKKASSKIAKRRKFRQYAGLFLKISLPVALIISVVFLSRADFLQVKNFEVAGAQTVSQESIKNIAESFATGTKFFVIPKSNIFVLNKEKLAAALLAKFGRLEKVEVNKQFFNENVELKITEREAEFLWCSGGSDCYFMAGDGLVFEKADDIAGKIIFRGILEGDPLMKNFSTPAKIRNYLNLIQVFKDAGFEITSINIESSDRAVAKSNIGDIIFSPEPARHDGESGGETDLSLVAQNAVLLINEVKSKNHSAVFNYIDARFGNKMFYKLK